MLFLGDAINLGSNDYRVTKLGLDAVRACDIAGNMAVIAVIAACLKR